MVKNATQPESVITFDRSQQRVFNDDSRVIAVNWHRQKGKDFVSAAKAVDSALNKGGDWFIVSLTQRQADATFRKAKKFAEAYKALLKIQGKLQFTEREYEEFDKTINHTFQCKAREIVFPNGARVVSLPGRDPDTLAGLTGNVIFTEFGLFPNGGYDHWRVVFPLATRGFQVMVISTPRGKNSKYFEICSEPETYSVHTCDIVQSVMEEGFVLRDNQGNETTIENFKKLYGDDIGWQREYMCKFMGDLEALLKWAQLQRATSLGEGRPFDLLRVKDDKNWQPGFFDRLREIEGRCEMGWDVARRGHISSLWINSYTGNPIRHLRAMVLMEDCSFTMQREIVTSAMNSKESNVGCGDATGLGMDSNETLANEFGDGRDEGRWEPVTFTAKSKSDLASLLKTTFDDGTQTLPSMKGEYKYIATDLYAIQKDESEGKLKLDETENPLLPQSHCDIAWSGGLALRAAGLNPVTAGLWSV